MKNHRCTNIGINLGTQINGIMSCVHMIKLIKVNDCHLHFYEASHVLFEGFAVKPTLAPLGNIEETFGIVFFSGSMVNQ